MRALSRNLDFVSEVARNLTTLGWNNYATDHEDGNGQFEQNFDFADALTTCDRAIFFRYMVETLAQERGLIATFMPKPFSHLTGNGCHFHMSLWRDGENAFARDPADDPRGLGLSEEAYSFIGGLKAHAKAYIAITAPTVTSYKRLVVGSRSGSSWAPVYVSYGYNNRTQMLRVPAPGRVEDRTVDGSCNPYLGAAAVLAAGLDGIERGLDPGEPTTELNLHDLTDERRRELGVELLPANLLDATRELERDDVLRAALGTTDREDYVDYFVRTKQARVRRVARPGHSVGSGSLPAVVLTPSSSPNRLASHAAGSAWSTQRHHDRQRDDARVDLPVRHAEADDHADQRRRHDPGLPRPAQERDLGPRPPAAAIGQRARQDRQRPGDEQQHRQHREAGEEVVGEVAERDVHAQHDEHEQRREVGERWRRTGASPPRARRASPGRGAPCCRRSGRPGTRPGSRSRRRGRARSS